LKKSKKAAAKGEGGVSDPLHLLGGGRKGGRTRKAGEGKGRPKGEMGEKSCPIFTLHKEKEERSFNARRGRRKGGDISDFNAREGKGGGGRLRRTQKRSREEKKKKGTFPATLQNLKRGRSPGLLHRKGKKKEGGEV